MQSVNGAQLLIFMFFLLYGAAAFPLFEIIIGPLTKMYASL